MLDESYWSERYRQARTGWDLGQPSPPLMQLMEKYPDKDARILIPGAGNAYDWIALCQAGYQSCYALDISAEPIERLKAAYPQWSNRLIIGDFFEEKGTWDIILEQTFFCALHPKMRPDYAVTMHRLLSEKGRLCGVLFDRDFEGGPPFGGDPCEYKTYFDPYFEYSLWEPCLVSYPPRQGSEWIMDLKKKG